MQAQTGRFGALGQKGLVSFLDLNRRCKKSRYAAGVCLFAIFSRSRASDLKVCDHWDLDLEDIKMSGKGFVECVTRNHKTTRQTAQQAVPMPLIAPQMALFQLPGGPSGSKFRPSVDVDRQVRHFEELSAWLRSVLERGGFDVSSINFNLFA